MPGEPPVQELRFLRLGALSPVLAEQAVAAVSREVSVPCRLAGPFEIDGIPLLEGREQADADALLLALEQGPADSRKPVVGLTAFDMGTRIFQFVFGRARQAGNAAVVSLARLDPLFYGLPPDPPLALRRLVLEILHELGHVSGIGHCADFSCRMHFVANVESLDVRGSGLCVQCKELELPGRRLSA